MKRLIVNYLVFLLAIPGMSVFAQPVARFDAIPTLNALVAPPASTGEAYNRAYGADGTHNGATTFYKSWQDQLDRVGLDIQTLLLHPAPQKPAVAPVSKVSPKQQAAMDATTAEMARKMTSDPEFAQKFARMSEAEQQAYITNMLADNGLKPASGTPNTNMKPVAGTDIDWMGMANTLMQDAVDIHQWDAQVELQTKYAALHQAVDDEAGAQIQKVPMIEMGEYGHDRDPEKVKVIQQKAVARHREVAESQLKESVGLFGQYRERIKERIRPFNQALKDVDYGTSYDFGITWQIVLQAQAMMAGELGVLCKFASDVTEEAASWEARYRETETR